MSRRITMQNDIVTGKRFVEIGNKGTVSIKKRLADTLVSYHELQNQFDLKEISQIALDDTITPSEKALLKERWESMTSSYVLLINTLESSDLDELEGVDDLKRAYSDLYATFAVLFADMGSASPVPENLENQIQYFNEKCNLVSQKYSAITYKLQALDLKLETTRYYLKEGESAVIKATLYRGMQEYAESDADSIYETLEWTATGLTNPIANYVSGRTATIPYSDIDVSFNLTASVKIPTESL